MDLNSIKKLFLETIGEENIIIDADMAQQTSFRAGGKADMLVIPQDIQQLKYVISQLYDSNIQYMLIGNGSNILVKDGGFRGVIVKMGSGFESVHVEDQTVVCGAAAKLSVAAKEAANAGLEGFEFASGIPGSIGGAVFMNAGAYDGEIKMILESVHIISRDGKCEYDKTAEDLDMSYRHTQLHESGDIVTEATFKLINGDVDSIKSKIAELTARRNSKQPVTFPSAGSFFKRPEGHFAGKLIQDAGLKGLTVGGAQVSELHSGFIINIGGATASDIIQLMEIVQAAVMDKFGVKMEPEVRIVGEES